MFIVIEGDNGSGKTTVSRFFRNLGFVIITEIAEIKELEKIGKQNKIGLKKRYETFLQYNKLCGQYSRNYKDSLIVRYWISTIAAAYSDGVLSLDDSIKSVIKVENELERPNCIFRLKCNYEQRLMRIFNRGSDNKDDTSLERDRKYNLFLDTLDNMTDYMHTIDTTNTSSYNVFKQMINIMEGVS